ncbi:DMT family transporter [Prolixibacteraceae bacterium Z1-6]|uniref:DMT family transporter n=1 Tax=Draconibacterium aestuarii TaxID=2998507 RepID=A0A9X3F973_9BACT|nr:DMT family transporter [Prolixibacteraceae bacterium Z1-6]
MWAIFGLASALFLGIYDIFKKQSLNHNAVMPVLFFSTIASSLIFIPLLIISRTSPDLLLNSGFFVPRLTPGEHLHVLLKSVIVVASWVLSFFALKHLPITIVTPIRATGPLWTLVGALLIFHERLNGFQWLGILITLVFFYIFSTAGKLEGIHFKTNKWIFFIVGATILGAASGLYDKYIMTRIDRIAVQAWFSFYQVLVLLPFVLLNERIRKRKNIRFEWRWTIPFIGVFLVIADFLYFYALSNEDALISVISALRRGSVLVTFLVGGFLFKEQNLKKKGLYLLGILTGIVLLTLGTLLN